MRRVSQGREGGEVDDGRGLKILSIKKEPRYKKKKETIRSRGGRRRWGRLSIMIEHEVGAGKCWRS